MRDKRSDQYEVELTLLVCSNRPQITRDKLADIDEIDGFALDRNVDQAIHDLYFDSTDGALRSAGISLRIRQLDSRIFITLKGPRYPTGPFKIIRREIELFWSYNALSEIITYLNRLPGNRRFIRAPCDDGSFRDTSPRHVLLGLGLEIIQERITSRKVRNILMKGQGSGHIVAELMIDSVIFQFAGRCIYHYEVEVEEKTDAPALTGETIAKNLMRKYEGELMPWPHSKLRTGRGIEVLMRQGKWREYIGHDGSVSPRLYDIVDRKMPRLMVLWDVDRTAARVVAERSVDDAIGDN